ncbi:MAG: restriction endonuclease subunit S [Sulfuricaulis sp.]|uniref:restriction endonuclease subunit S n=1 Tax=Sulfuricaulis sp. TaxID=2003553 RepID=UPI0034A40A76
MSEHSLLLESPPPGWTPARFGDICNRAQDAASPSANGGRLYLGLEHLASGHPALVGRGKESDVRSGKTEFHKRDVLFGKLRPYLRKSVLVNEDGICSTDILVFRATEKSIPDFLCLLTHTDEFVGHAKATTSGVQHPRTSWASLREFRFHVPPLSEQRKIAGVLGMVQLAIEQQERLLQLTAELKKTLLHQLFTQGLRGEPQKETEIGPVPESWEVTSLESAAIAFDYGTSVKCEHGKAGFPVLRIPNVIGGSIDLGDLKHGQPKRTELDTLRLRDGDLLFVRTNGVLENAGRCALYRGELDDCYFASYLIRVRVDHSKVLPAFVNEYARTERGKSFLSGRAIRTADGKFNINSGTLKRVLLPLPSLEEQEEIVRQLDVVERKCRLHDAKRSAFNGLFHTLLHLLMTAQIRVGHLDISESQEPSGLSEGGACE